jgi:hypothetical protein
MSSVPKVQNHALRGGRAAGCRDLVQLDQALLPITLDILLEEDRHLCMATL